MRWYSKELIRISVSAKYLAMQLVAIQPLSLLLIMIIRALLTLLSLGVQS